MFRRPTTFDSRNRDRPEAMSVCRPDQQEDSGGEVSVHEADVSLMYSHVTRGRTHNDDAGLNSVINSPRNGTIAAHGCLSRMLSLSNSHNTKYDVLLHEARSCVSRVLAWNDDRK